MCIVHNRDKGKIIDDLVNGGFKFTIIGTTGGFLREGNTTILIGTEESSIEQLLEIVHRDSQAREQLVNVSPYEPVGPSSFIATPVKVPVGGAVVFILDVERFERY
jgi:uncharacterized protein YaaQ